MSVILVLGATGQVGREVVNQLLERKQQVRVLARDESKAQGLFGAANAQLQVVQGDVFDADSVKKAATGAARMFLLTPTAGAVEGTIAQAAKAAGVQHIVKLSCLFASTNEPFGSVMRAHGDAEAEVLKAGVPVTFLRANDFMQNRVAYDAHGIRTIGKFFDSIGETPVSCVDCRDVAACAAAILCEPIEKHANLSYDLTGPEALSKTTQARMLSELTGKQVEYVSMSDAEYHKLLIDCQLPAFLIHLLLRLGQAFRAKSASGYFTTDIEIILGRPARNFAAYIAENRAAFV